MVLQSKMNRIRNERIRGTTKEGEISTKVQERRLGAIQVLRNAVGDGRVSDGFALCSVSNGTQTTRQPASSARQS